VSARQIDQQRLILLEEGHCLRDQALAYCATARQKMPLSLGATSLATVMQMVASGYGVTLVPQVAVDVEVRDQRVKLLRFTAPEPGRTIGLAWRRTSPRKVDFVALGQIVVEALGAGCQSSGPKPAARGHACRRADIVAKSSPLRPMGKSGNNRIPAAGFVNQYFLFTPNPGKMLLAPSSKIFLQQCRHLADMTTALSDVRFRG
jgi:hypothetical protein